MLLLRHHGDLVCSVYHQADPQLARKCATKLHHSKQLSDRAKCKPCLKTTSCNEEVYMPKHFSNSVV